MSKEHLLRIGVDVFLVKGNPGSVCAMIEGHIKKA